MFTLSSTLFLIVSSVPFFLASDSMIRQMSALFMALGNNIYDNMHRFVLPIFNCSMFIVLIFLIKKTRRGPLV